MTDVKYVDEKKSDQDQPIKLPNPHLELMPQDFLYHIGLDTKTHDLKKMFGDVKFVCAGGMQSRMKAFAYYIKDVLNYDLEVGTDLVDISAAADRYSMYKIGPVLSISHGIGVPSLGVLIHEILKTLYYAEAVKPVFFRIGTCGGIGYDGGTVVISRDAMNGRGHKYHETYILGEPVRRPAIFDATLVEELLKCVDPQNTYKTVTGTTMCSDDFYEGQARLNGAFCNYTREKQMDYLFSLRDRGVVNIEMEATAFAAMTHHAGIKAADVCVAYLDRLKGEQVDASKASMNEWQVRPQKLVGTYIKKALEKKN